MQRVPVQWLYVLLLCVLVVAEQLTDSPCLDFASRPGTCGRIRDCPALYRMVNGRTPTHEEVLQLRQSQCGQGKGQLLLCCAYGPTNPFRGPPEQHPNRAVLDNGSVCGSLVGTRITGGLPVPLERNPWLALIGYTQSDSANVTYECGGALIGPRHVLTAAHCVTGLPEGFRLHSVRLGENDLRTAHDCGPTAMDEHHQSLCGSAPQELQIVSVDIHEDYNKPFRMMNDLALLALDDVAQEGQTIGRVCLPYGPVEDLTGVELTVSGFGRVGGPDGPLSPVPLEVKLPGVKHQQCAEIIALLGGRLGPNQLCAGGERGKDVCFGDSGAPLTTSATEGETVSVVGLVAFGDKSCQGNIPGVFTRVSAYLNWILDRVA